MKNTKLTNKEINALYISIYDNFLFHAIDGEEYEKGSLDDALISAYEKISQLAEDKIDGIVMRLDAKEWKERISKLNK